MRPTRAVDDVPALIDFLGFLGKASLSGGRARPPLTVSGCYGKSGTFSPI
jgi:hypothetical protein